MTSIRKHCALPAALSLTLALTGCANRASTEILYRAEGAEVGTAKVALLPVIVEDDGPTFFYYLALPLIWVARTIQLDFTTDNLEPAEGGDVLRDLCYLALDQATSDARPVPLPLVDRIVREYGGSSTEPELFERLYEELGADVFLTIYLERWGSDYYVLETRNNVRARIEIHSRDLGYEEPLLRALVNGNDGAGVSGGPTGFFDLAVAPLAGVDTGPILDLAAQVALGIGTLVGGLEESAELTDPPGISGVETRISPGRRLPAPPRRPSTIRRRRPHELSHRRSDRLCHDAQDRRGDRRRPSHLRRPDRVGALRPSRGKQVPGSCVDSDISPVDRLVPTRRGWACAPVRRAESPRNGS